MMIVCMLNSALAIHVQLNLAFIFLPAIKTKQCVAPAKGLLSTQAFSCTWLTCLIIGSQNGFLFFWQARISNRQPLSWVLLARSCHKNYKSSTKRMETSWHTTNTIWLSHFRYIKPRDQATDSIKIISEATHHYLWQIPKLYQNVDQSIATNVRVRE